MIQAPSRHRPIRINDAALAHIRSLHYTDTETESDRIARELGDYEADERAGWHLDGDPVEVFERLREPVPSAFAAD